jgi:hypothetical protein
MGKFVSLAVKKAIQDRKLDQNQGEKIVSIWTEVEV